MALRDLLDYSRIEWQRQAVFYGKNKAWHGFQGGLKGKMGIESRQGEILNVHGDTAEGAGAASGTPLKRKKNPRKPYARPGFNLSKRQCLIFGEGGEVHFPWLTECSGKTLRIWGVVLLDERDGLALTNAAAGFHLTG